MATRTSAPAAGYLVEPDVATVEPTPVVGGPVSPNRLLHREGIPLAIVVITVAISLWLLRGELTPAQNLNDGSLHTSMIRWASQQIDQGRLPLDGWYPYLSMGLPQFHHYQSLPHVITAYVARNITSEQAYLWTLYGLLATWPLSIYLGGRILGLEPWPSAAAAALSPLLQSASGYGLEDSSYTWRGLGLWTQLWGAWLLPITIGLSFRAVARARFIVLAAIALALTFACNFITGYLALILVPMFVVIGRSDFVGRLCRAVLVGLGAIAASSWVIVPLLADRDWSNQSEFFSGFWRDSYGAAQVLRWLVSGSLYDHMRPPLVTVLLAVGLGVCLLRSIRSEQSRALLSIWALSMLLFFGRPTLGWFADLLPASGDLMLHRFVIGPHLAGLFLAGVGGAWLGRGLVRVGSRLPWPRAPQIVTFMVGIAGVAIALPAWLQRASYNSTGAEWIRFQAEQDASSAEMTALIERARRLGGGRVYAGSNFNWGREYRVGFVPVYTTLLNRDLSAVGFNMRTIQSLSHDVESRFDENNPAHYALFNVRYLILPPGRTPGVTAEAISGRGPHRLWRIDTTGYVSLVDTQDVMSADRTNVGIASDRLLKSLPVEGSPLPTVAYAGRRAERPTVGGSTLGTTPGRVLTSSEAPTEGAFAAEVNADRQAVVLLRATFHPRWTVMVDGRNERPVMVGPSFIGVNVSPGRHSVEFRYQPFDDYLSLIALGCVALLAVELLHRYLSRRKPTT